MRSNKILFIIFFFSFAIGQSSNTISGFVDFNYISRLSDGSLINLPYRLFRFNVDHESSDILFRSNIAVEHRLRESTHFLSDQSPTDFSLDMREFYLQMFTSWGEFKIGKMIHTWGNVDENSPIDVVSPYDYYYTFESGSDKKLGVFSSTIDLYLNNYKFGLTLSPLHNTHRTPQENDDFPIKLPSNPSSEEFMEISGMPLELGIYAARTFGVGDISVNYFEGFDRLFNLSGVNVYAFGPDKSFSIIDIIYGYRKTKMLGFGSTLFLGNTTFRGDAAFFNTSDKNSAGDFLLRSSSYQSQIYDSLHYSYPLKEKANYFQATLQFEVDLPFDIKFIGQLFTYDTLDYQADSLPIDDDISIPNLEISIDELDPKNIFTPGYGSSLGVLTKKAVIISLNKSFANEQLTISVSSLLDIDNTSFNGSVPGLIFSFETSYIIKNNIHLVLGYTKIKGNNKHPLGEDYRINIMEDFSHLRANLKFNF